MVGGVGAESAVGAVVSPYFERDGITIYHGDCRVILPQLDTAGFALVTDPPYGLGDLWRGGDKKWPLNRQGEAVQWDDAPVPELPGMVASFGVAIVWGGHYYQLPPARGWLVWDKIVRNFSSGHCELAWTTLDQPVRAFSYAHAQLASEGKVHPTQKPLPLMRWCLGFLPPHTPLVDPFMGSGTTLRAAMDLGRRAIGIEIEERYCEIAARRLDQLVLPFEVIV